MLESPEDPAYLAALIERTPLLPDPRLRSHWHSLLAWLTIPERYELAAILVGIEQQLSIEVPM